MNDKKKLRFYKCKTCNRGTTTTNKEVFEFKTCNPCRNKKILELEELFKKLDERVLHLELISQMPLQEDL